MKMQVKLVVSILALMLGLIVAPLPSSTALADIAPCANCAASVSVDASGAVGGIGVIVDYSVGVH